MTKLTITRERIAQIANPDAWVKCTHEEVQELARMALAAMDSEPVAWTWHYREQWHVTNEEERARDLAWDGVKIEPLYRHAQLESEVVVTRNERGDIVAVTRQDAEGRVIDVIAEAAQPAPLVSEVSPLVSELTAPVAVIQSSKPLYDFYRDYADWISRGGDGRFSCSNGLCANLFDYCGHKDIDSAQVLNEMHAQFVTAGLKEKLPFNVSGVDFDAESADGECHLNTGRREWVAARISDGIKPAPVVLDEGRADFEAWMLKRWGRERRDYDFAKAKFIYGEDYADSYTRCVWKAWSASRAAMLQAGTLTNEGTKQASNSPVIPGAEQRIADAVELLKQAAPAMLADNHGPDGPMVGMLKSPAIPDGYVMVPKVVTPAMAVAGGDVFVKSEQVSEYPTDAARNIYRAMLADAPQPQNAPQNIPEIIPRWIPVSERMPDDAQEVIVQTHSGWRYIAFFEAHSGLFYDSPEGDVEYVLVTHWMPLPAAPREVKDGKN